MSVGLDLYSGVPDEGGVWRREVDFRLWARGTASLPLRLLWPPPQRRTAMPSTSRSPRRRSASLGASFPPFYHSILLSPPNLRRTVLSFHASPTDRLFRIVSLAARGSTSTIIISFNGLVLLGTVESK